MEVLARVFYDEARARDLLERAEIRMERLPPWGTLTAEMFWRAVLRELEHGLVPRGFEKLLGEASERYPGNEELQALLGRPQEGNAPAPSDPSIAPPSGAKDAKFDVFLAHNSQDKPAVRELGRLLKERGLKVWLDEWNLKPGDVWQEVLAEIIQTTNSAAVLLGSDGVGPWQRLEIQGALMEFVGRGLPVIPVLLPGAPEAPELPFFLKNFTWSDLRSGYDVEGLDRLEWGITGRKPERSLAPTSPPSPSQLSIKAWLRHIRSMHGELAPALREGAMQALRHVYVELRLVEREALVESGQRMVLGGRLSLEKILALDPWRDGEWITGRWLLYGDPGSGKTTLLRHLALTLAERGLDGETTWIPVFESLPRLLRDHPGPVHYPKFLATQLQQVSGEEAEAWGMELDRLAGEGRLLLLFDGLDEVASTDRRRVTQLLSGVTSRDGWDRVQVVVTARPLGGYSPGADFRPLEILPFAEADRREFLALWLGEGDSRDDLAAEAALARFREDPAVWELSGNPLYLTLLALLLGDGVEIPERRSELYSEIFDFLLEGRHRDGDSIGHTLAVETVLEELAWAMTHEGLDAEPLKSLERRLDRSPDAKDSLGCSEEWAKRPRRFLEAVGKKTSILGAHDGPRADWRYWHRTFREALAARRLSELHESEGESTVLAHAGARTSEDAGRWAEPYALLAGGLDSPDGLILSLVDSNAALGLRALCTVPKLETSTVDQILERLRESEGEDEDSEGWEKRAQVYRRIPEFLGDAKGSLDLLERLRRDTKEPHDLFFLEEAMVEVGKRWPDSESEVTLRRSRFFDHLAPPSRDLFEKIVVPSSDDPVAVWREIPSGGFLMGSPSSEPDYDKERAPLGAFGNERPQHEVRFTRAFSMMSTPVTNAQYLAFNSSHEVRSWDGVSGSEVLSHPVVNVSWYAACAFCRWLSRGGFPGARLPSESEWEYICRAGTQSRFWSGDSEEDLARVGWYNSNSGGRTHCVGELSANPWGLYDVHGNVWEWCEDTGGNYAEHASPEPLVDPPADMGDVWNTRKTRVLRGGSWAGGPRGLRAAYRIRRWSRSRHDGVGFRVLLCRFPEP